MKWNARLMEKYVGAALMVDRESQSTRADLALEREQSTLL